MVVPLSLPQAARKAASAAEPPVSAMNLRRETGSLATRAIALLAAASDFSVPCSQALVVSSVVCASVGPLREARAGRITFSLQIGLVIQSARGRRIGGHEASRPLPLTASPRSSCRRRGSGCGGGGCAPRPPPATQPPELQSGNLRRRGRSGDDQGLRLRAADLTVAGGTTVKFTNEDSTPHTATSKDSGAFESGTIETGKSADDRRSTSPAPSPTTAPSTPS